MVEIQKRIKEVRSFSRLTQTEFAKTLKISRDSLAKIENKRNMPTIGVLTSIVNIYHISYDWLIAGQGQMLKEDVITNNKELTEDLTGHIIKKSSLDIKKELGLKDSQVELLERFIDARIKKIIDRIEIKIK